MLVFENFDFLVNGQDLSIVVEHPIVAIKSLEWDEKNTILMQDDDDNKYAFVNILPNIREILQKVTSVMIVFQQNNDIIDAYEVELSKNSNLSFEDNFNSEAIACLRKLEDLKKTSS